MNFFFGFNEILVSNKTRLTINGCFCKSVVEKGIIFSVFGRLKNTYHLTTCNKKSSNSVKLKLKNSDFAAFLVL